MMSKKLLPSRVQVHRNTTNIEGQSFGRLVVLWPLGPNRDRKMQWLCRCRCGRRFIANGKLIRLGKIVSCGCQKIDNIRKQSEKNIKGENPEYSAAHWNLRRKRGKASDFPCALCGSQADEYAYDHDDPEELISEVNGYPYSLNPDHYMPMCGPCHRMFDRYMKQS